MTEPTLTEIKDRALAAAGTGHDPEALQAALEALISVVPTVLREVRETERDATVQRIRTLAEGRKRYLHTDPQTSLDIETMGGMQATIYGEVIGTQAVAAILAGERTAHGWLPSWLWDTDESSREPLRG